MQVSFEIPDLYVRNAVVAAYLPWADRTTNRSVFLLHTWNTSFIVNETGDGGIDKDHEVTISTVRKGLALLARNAPEHFQYLMCNRSDAETGNLLIQYACFGEQKYA